MLECNESCWADTDLANYSMRLDQYTRDNENYGPIDVDGFDPSAGKIRWTKRKPTNSRLIQLAFHDCLK